MAGINTAAVDAMRCRSSGDCTIAAPSPMSENNVRADSATVAAATTPNSSGAMRRTSTRVVAIESALAPSMDSATQSTPLRARPPRLPVGEPTASAAIGQL